MGRISSLYPPSVSFLFKRLALWVKVSADDILNYAFFFQIFPRKQDLTFHANCLKYRTLFSGKVRRRLLNVPR